MFKRFLQSNKKDQNLLTYCTPELAQLGSAGLAGQGPKVPIGKRSFISNGVNRRTNKDQSLLSYCTAELAQLGSAGLAGRGPTVPVGNGWVLMDSMMFN